MLLSRAAGIYNNICDKKHQLGIIFLKIFVISLLRSPERRARISSQLNQLNIEFEFFDAIDGSKGDHTLWTNYNYIKRKWLISGKQPSRGELGCFASHYLLWRRCIELNEPLLLIEDDSFIKPNFAEHLASIDHELKKFPFLRLESETGLCSITPIKKNSHYSIGFMSDNTGGTRSYAIAPTAAIKLLEGANRWCMPVDNYIGTAYLHKVSSYIYQPAVILDTNEFGTTIQLGNEGKAPKYIKLSRELYKGYQKLRMRTYNSLIRWRGW